MKTFPFAVLTAAKEKFAGYKRSVLSYNLIKVSFFFFPLGCDV